MRKPFVSVIIPNYNHALYLDQRIQSVLNQTYTDFEVIILDDKSPDNSKEVIEKYRNSPKVSHIIINTENSGSTFIQWNKGFELAKGDLIWIAESDDFCTDNFLEECVRQFQNNPNVSVVFCASEYVDANNAPLPTYKFPLPESINYFEGKRFIRERMDYGCMIWNASSAVFKKEIALKIDKNYQEFKACGDKLFWIMMAEHGDVVFINKVMNFFRQHQNKVSPKRFRDGTSLTEQKMIFNYQCDHRYLGVVQKNHILNLYRLCIASGDFESEDVRKRLNKLWGFGNKFYTLGLSLISRLYVYHSIYIKRVKS